MRLKGRKRLRNLFCDTTDHFLSDQICTSGNGRNFLFPIVKEKVSSYYATSLILARNIFENLMLKYFVANAILFCRKTIQFFVTEYRLFAFSTCYSHSQNEYLC